MKHLTLSLITLITISAATPAVAGWYGVSLAIALAMMQPTRHLRPAPGPVPTAASLVEPPPAKAVEKTNQWQLAEEVDSMYGTRNVQLTLRSRTSTNDFLIDCYRGKIHVAYKPFLGQGPSDEELRKSRVLVKEDSSAPRPEYWLYSDTAWYLHPQATTYLRKLIRVKTLRLEYTEALTHYSYTDEFDLDGLSELAPKVLQACHSRGLGQ